MRKYPNINEIQNRITRNNTVHLSYQAKEINDIIHCFSVPGYEYLSGSFVAFLERFRPVLPKKLPVVLEIKGASFSAKEKEVIDKAIWTHYGLYLSEASVNMKKTRIRMIIYLILMVLSSSLLFLVSNSQEEVLLNYGYVLFWFFAYRLLIHLILDCLPIYKEYKWYRRLSSLKLIFSDENSQILDSDQLSKESSQYAHEADDFIRKHKFVNDVLMEDSYVSLGCRIENVEDAIFPSGAEGIEIVSDEMTDYLMSALPFIKQKDVTKLTIEGKNFTTEEKKRITSALRNYLAFTISKSNIKKKRKS